MNSMSLEVLFTPAEFAGLSRRNLRETVCVVFDILRATSTMMTALANGAGEILPVGEIAEALAIRRSRPEILLAGERNGLRILAAQTGSVDFDLGNSPREFTPEKVRGKNIVMTTTNGTRALRACAAARSTLIGSFLGMRAIAAWIARAKPSHLLLVCSGTVDQAAYEDTLAAGALCDLIWPDYSSGNVSDSARIAQQIYQASKADLLRAAQNGRNGRRLLAVSELREDVPFCFQQDTIDFLAELGQDGVVRRLAKPIR
ncbi:MAG: 2-phosphosulfolactate phosphatase [Verrucomicrobia bacterium]|nr:2-phosphosulfolactate phosphatase [Verrucomicrobiota bacterium]